jgi:hypothetical protein
MTVRPVALIAHAEQDREIDRDRQQSQARHQKAGNGAGLEGDVEARGKAVGGGLRRAHIGADRDMHADEAGRTRKHRADQEAEGGRP